MATTTVNPSTTASPSTTSTTTSIPPVTTTPEPSQKLFKLWKDLNDFKEKRAKAESIKKENQKQLADINKTFAPYDDIIGYLGGSFSPTEEEIKKARKYIAQSEFQAEQNYLKAIADYGPTSDKTKIANQGREYAYDVSNKISDKNIEETLNWLDTNYNDYLDEIFNRNQTIDGLTQEIEEYKQKEHDTMYQILLELQKINNITVGQIEATNRFAQDALRIA